MKPSTLCTFGHRRQSRWLFGLGCRVSGLGLRVGRGIRMHLSCPAIVCQSFPIALNAISPCDEVALRSSPKPNSNLGIWEPKSGLSPKKNQGLLAAYSSLSVARLCLVDSCSVPTHP